MTPLSSLFNYVTQVCRSSVHHYVIQTVMAGMFPLELLLRKAVQTDYFKEMQQGREVGAISIFKLSEPD